MNTVKNKWKDNSLFSQMFAVACCNTTEIISQEKKSHLCKQKKEKPTKVTFFFPGEYLSFYETWLFHLCSQLQVLIENALVSLNSYKPPSPGEMKINILSLWHWHHLQKKQVSHLNVNISGQKARLREKNSKLLTCNLSLLLLLSL